MPTNDPCRANFYSTLSVHIYGGGKPYFDNDMKNERFDHFTNETGCKIFKEIQVIKTK